MTETPQHPVGDCLEVARNQRFCAGAERAGSEIWRLREKLSAANARERKAFENGVVILTNEAGVPFSVTAEIDLEQLWQQYRCQDETDWRATTPEEAAAIDTAALPAKGSDNDLIQRLRATNKRVRHSQELRDEAADEIEQLQEVRKAARLVVSASTHESAQRHIRRLNDKLIEYDRLVNLFGLVATKGSGNDD